MFIRQHESCKAKAVILHRRQNQFPIPRTTAPFRQMVRPKPIPRRNPVYRYAGLQAFRNDLRLDLVRPPLLPVGTYLNPVVPEKLHRSRYRETPAPISISREVAGQAKTGKVGARKRLQEYRGIATRFCKTDTSYSALISLAATVIRLR